MIRNYVKFPVADAHARVIEEAPPIERSPRGSIPALPMKSVLKLLAPVFAWLLLLSSPLLALSPKFEGATSARIENGYVFVLLANGTKSIVQLSSLKPEDREWLTKLSVDSPLARGNSQVIIVKEVVKPKTTIAVSTIVGPLETVQLVPPNVPRDQIGGTCMVYARVHWLDIAGFYVDNVDIYKIINVVDPDHPWTSPSFYPSMTDLVLRFKPIIHSWTPKVDPFDWTRQELRKGRPVLAAFPREIWQDLPPGFVGKHPWNGGNVGHQIVINGFTWNEETHEGTFHIVNSWKELPEFDLKTEMARGAMNVEASLSPKGEQREVIATKHVTKVTLIKAVGKTNLYEVETNVGIERVAAPDPDSARGFIEGATVEN
jgi:hypothetical protein